MTIFLESDANLHAECVEPATWQQRSNARGQYLLVRSRPEAEGFQHAGAGPRPDAYTARSNNRRSRQATRTPPAA